MFPALVARWRRTVQGLFLAGLPVLTIAFLWSGHPVPLAPDGPEPPAAVVERPVSHAIGPPPTPSSSRPAEVSLEDWAYTRGRAGKISGFR